MIYDYFLGAQMISDYFLGAQIISDYFLGAQMISDERKNKNSRAQDPNIESALNSGGV